MRRITRRGADEDEGYEEPYWDWTDLHDVMSASELIDSMRQVPFCVYMTRYILGKHGEATDASDRFAGTKNAGKSGAENIGKAGDNAAETGVSKARIDRAAELAWEDFPKNGCVRKTRKKEEGMFFPYSGRWMSYEELREILAADRVKTADLICLAFGLGMPFGVLNDFLRKVCRRAGLNLWNDKELLTYIVFRFMEADSAPQRQEAYLALAEAYKKENTTEKKVLAENNATESIRTYTDRMMTATQGGEESIRAWLRHPEEDAPEALRALLREYRRTQNAKGDHVRTATKKAYELWKSFREVADEDIESFAKGGAMEKEAILEKRRLEEPAEDDGYLSEEPEDARDGAYDAAGNSGAKAAGTGRNSAGNDADTGDGGISGKTASGTVQIYYEPGQTFVLPKGVKIRFKGHDFIFRENETADLILPGDRETILKAAVRSEAEASEGAPAVTKAAAFYSADMRFHGIHPSSSFKPKKAGKRIFLEGNLEIPCLYGTRVEEGSIFLREETGEAFRTVKMADCPVCLTAVSDLEVTKDELRGGEFVTAAGEPWRSPVGIRVGNKKIGYGKFERAAAKNAKEGSAEEELSGEQGVTVKYLYYSHAKEELSGDMTLDEAHVRVLRERIFRPETKFSASKIYSLEKRRRTEVSREDILTLIFLNFAAQRQFGEIGEEAYDATAQQWLGAFIATADRILGECGFYGVYRADPYDAMLCYLAASTDEPLNAFRNLWGMILHE